jgi:hypothetical protein
MFNDVNVTELNETVNLIIFVFLLIFRVSKFYFKKFMNFIKKVFNMISNQKQGKYLILTYFSYYPDPG